MSTGGVQRLISTKPSALTTTDADGTGEADRGHAVGALQHQQGDAREADRSRRRCG